MVARPFLLRERRAWGNRSMPARCFWNPGRSVSSRGDWNSFSLRGAERKDSVTAVLLTLLALFTSSESPFQAILFSHRSTSFDRYTLLCLTARISAPVRSVRETPHPPDPPGSETPFLESERDRDKTPSAHAQRSVEHTFIYISFLPGRTAYHSFWARHLPWI